MLTYHPWHPEDDAPPTADELRRIAANAARVAVQQAEYDTVDRAFQERLQGQPVSEALHDVLLLQWDRKKDMTEATGLSDEDWED